MKSRYYIFSLLLSSFFISLPGQMKESGAAIVLNASGLVEAVSPDGKKVPGLVKRGSVLTEGFTISTGAFAESVLLFSNGTVATLNEKTAVRISIFSQEPFEAGNINFEGMQGEPSHSHLSLSLLNGSLVVKTKKLNDLSVFNIKTVEGVIRVKGTEFQLGASQDQGIQLDVSESTVSFLPKGSSKPIQVSGGSGLDVGKGGTNQRPISPITAQKISTKNRFASVIASKVPLSTIKQASAKAQTVAGRSSSESDDQDDEAYEDEYEEEQEGEEGKSEQALAVVQTSARVANAIISDATETNSASETEKKYREQIEALSNATPSAQSYSLAAGEDNTPTIYFYEANTLPTGQEEEEVQPLKTLSYTAEEFDQIKENPSALVSEFASLFGDNSKEVDALAVFVFLEDHFSTWSPTSYNTADLYLGLNKALELAYKVLLNDTSYTSSASLNSASLDGSLLYNDFVKKDGYGEHAVRIIGHYASSNDRDSIMQISQDVFAIFNGTQETPTSVAFGSSQSSDTVALNTELLYSEDRKQEQEVTLLNENTSSTQEIVNSSPLNSAVEEERNNLEREIYKTKLENLSVVPGRDITLGETNGDTKFNLTSSGTYSANAEDRKSFAITATDDLHLKGDITFQNENIDEQNPGHDVLLLGAADHIEGLQYNPSNDRQKITNDGTHLVMGSYSHLTARNVDIKTSGKLAIGSLEDLVLDTVKFDAGRASKNDNITLYSDQTLHLRDPDFIGNAKEIYMQGITVNFENVTFDTSKAYLVRSKTGEVSFDNDPIPGNVNFLGNNYWGEAMSNGSNKIDEKFFYPVSTKGDSAVDGRNSYETVTLSTGETAGIRIRQIQ